MSKHRYSHKNMIEAMKNNTDITNLSTIKNTYACEKLISNSATPRPIQQQNQKFSCSLGCREIFYSYQNLRKHYILMHSQDELSKWGMSRHFLKLLEG